MLSVRIIKKKPASYLVWILLPLMFVLILSLFVSHHKIFQWFDHPSPEASIAELEHMLHKNPTAVKPRLKLIEILITSGRYHQAMSHLKVIDLVPLSKDHQTERLYAQLRVLNHLYTKAVEVPSKITYQNDIFLNLSDLLKVATDDTILHYGALLSRRLNHDEMTMAFYRRLVSLHSDSKLTWLEEASAFWRSKGAHKVLTESYVTLIMDHTPLNNPLKMAEIALSESLLTHNRAFILKTVENIGLCYPTHNLMNYRLAKIAFSKEAYSLARHYLKNAMTYGSLNPDALKMVKTMAITLENDEIAIAALNQLLNDYPKDLSLHKEISVLYLKNKAYENALDHQLSLALNTESATCYHSAMDTAIQIGAMEAKIQLLKKRMGHETLTESELFQLADAFEKRGEPDEGISLINGYLKKNSDHRAVYNTLAWLLERNENIAELLDLRSLQLKTVGLNRSEIVSYARWMWESDQPDKALALLKGHADQYIPDDALAQKPNEKKDHRTHHMRSEYTKLMIDLAWLEEDRDLSFQLLHRIAQKEDGFSSETNLRRYLILLKEVQPESYIHWAEWGFIKYSDPRYIKDALDMALGLKNTQQLNDLLSYFTKDHSNHPIESEWLPSLLDLLIEMKDHSSFYTWYEIASKKGLTTPYHQKMYELYALKKS